MDTGRGEEWVRRMERIACKIDSQWEFAVWLRKLKQGLCVNLGRWHTAGDGREVQNGGDTGIPMTDSC